MSRYQLEYERLSEINPRLIFAHISGYGDQGLESQRRAFDVTRLVGTLRDDGICARTGANTTIARAGHGRSLNSYSVIRRHYEWFISTGKKPVKGSMVSTSLAANGVWANGMALQGVIAGNDLATHRQETGWINPFAGCYETADGRFLVLTMINTDREYPRLCAALGTEAWLSDARFESVRLAMRNRVEFKAAIATAFSQLTYAQASSRLDEQGITYGPVQTMSEVLLDKQLRANGVIVETGDAGDDYKLTIGSPD